MTLLCEGAYMYAIRRTLADNLQRACRREYTHITGVVVKRGRAVIVQHAGVAMADAAKAVLLLQLWDANTHQLC